MPGLGGLLKGLTKKVSIRGIVGKVKTAVGGIAKGGVGGGIIAAGAKIAKRVGRKNLKRAAVGGAVLGAAAGGAGLLGGGGEGDRRRYRRINPGNTRAMRRAIRRIEAGARIYSKFYSMKRGGIRGARGVRVKKLSIRRAA